MKQPAKDQQPSQEQPTGGEEIDWGNVASEVKTMLELNPAAAEQAETDKDTEKA